MDEVDKAQAEVQATKKLLDEIAASTQNFNLFRLPCCAHKVNLAGMDVSL